MLFRSSPIDDTSSPIDDTSSLIDDTTIHTYDTASPVDDTTSHNDDTARHSDDTTWLRLMSGHVKVVKETPEEIIKMMEKTSYLTIKNIKNG